MRGRRGLSSRAQRETCCVRVLWRTGRTDMPTPQETFAAAHRLHRSGQPAAAIPLYCEVIAAQPGFAEGHHQLGNALKALGRFEEALPPLEQAARLAPREAAIHLNLGVTRLELRQLPAAENAFRQAIALEPARPEAHNILGHTLLSQGRLGEASTCFHEALRLRPGYAPAHDNLGRLLRMQGRVPEAIASFRAALSLDPKPGTHSNLLLALNYVPGLSSGEILAEHRAWAERHAEPVRPPSRPPQPAPPRTGRLRVGYVSPDFAHHAVASFFEPVLAAHDRPAFEIFCYANVLAPDAVTARLRGLAEHWRDIAPLSDEQAAELIRADKLDLLIDLAGHTARNRLLVFARKPAPVQATWLGYPNTTGLDAIDFRLTDAVSDPAGRTDSGYSEKLVRMPGPFSVYAPAAESPSVLDLPARETGAVTFGCFNNFAKVTAEVIALWARLLAATPGARLFLKSRGLDDADTAARVQREFAERGISAGRIELDGRELSVNAHLDLYRRVDIALDTFPYNGTTTTCEALWMGVPVVTLAGQTHVSRVGASLLTHLGAPDWIAATPEEYVRIARSLAEDGPTLATIRAGLRERMCASPLCDAAGFTRALEAKFRELAGSKL